MSLTVTLIAKLTGLDPSDAARVVSTVEAQDNLAAPAPSEFARGRAARAYGLAVVIVRNPLKFWVGLIGLVAFPVYLLVRLGASLNG